MVQNGFAQRHSLEPRLRRRSGLVKEFFGKFSKQPSPRFRFRRHRPFRGNCQNRISEEINCLNSESQRDSGSEPRVARNELPWEKVEKSPTPTGLWRLRTGTNPLTRFYTDSSRKSFMAIPPITSAKTAAHARPAACSPPR